MSGPLPLSGLGLAVRAFARYVRVLPRKLVMTVNVPTTTHVPRYIRFVRLVWLAGTGVSVLAALAAVVTMPSEVTVVLLVVTLAQAGVAVPACLAVA